MRTAPPLLTLLLAAGCSPHAGTDWSPLTGQAGARITSPCQASIYLLGREMMLECDTPFGRLPPEIQRPCRRTAEYPDGTKLSGSGRNLAEGVTLGPDGNIATYRPRHAEGSVEYVYDGASRLTHAIYRNDTREAVYTFHYDGDRRTHETVEDSSGEAVPPYHYVWSGGTLVAEGVESASGQLPIPADLSLAVPGPDGSWLSQPEGTAAISYFADAQGQLATIATAPWAGPATRYDLSYDAAGLLVSAEVSGHLRDPLFTAVRWSFEHACAP